MAYFRRSLTSKEAWRIFEEAVAKMDSIEQAAEWLYAHPMVARKMTGAGLLACFEEDINGNAVRKNRGKAT